MKKKFFSLFVAAAVLCAAFAGLLTGCDGFGVFWENVSTYEELIAGYHSHSVRLKNDIDCEFATINPLYLGKTFDGNGYTIKNAVINADNGYASFVADSECIKNVTFENITVKGSGRCDAVVAAKDCKEISNVHVKNCKITATQTIRDARYSCFMGAIYGGTTDLYSHDEDEYAPIIDCVISDCTVENTEMILNEYKGEKINQANIYMGGIAGACSEITGSRVENCTLTAESSHMYCTPYVGGVVGTVSGGVENTCAINNKLTAKALYFVKEVLSFYTTSTAYSGGIAARAYPAETNYILDEIIGVNTCFAEGNEITVKSTGDVYAGGLLGYVTQIGVNQCYAKSNKIIMDNYKTGNKDDDIKRRCGGLIGSSGSNSIVSCFVYNDEGLSEYTFPTIKGLSKVSGFVAGFGNLTVNYCATFNADEKINAPTMDEFCSSKIDNLTNCYVSSTQFGNACGCETLDENFWDSPNSIKSKLLLSSQYWKFDNGIPYLDFS